jgi:osmotically-inducible protein OsmY
MTRARRIIEGSVAARLRQSPYPALRRISCRLGDAALILRGRVPSYYMKQVAQIIAVSVDGASVVQNELEVYRTSSTLEGP